MMKRGAIYLLGLWLGAIMTGICALMTYSQTPGTSANAPAAWPAGSHLEPASGLSTLIMFAHPKCPCTRASLAELEVIMQHCRGHLQAFVLFLQPTGTDQEWSHTELWRKAAAIPGVTVLADEQSHESQRFQVSTSGHVLLYDARQRRLQFSGGITAARGKSGNNRGRSALLAMLGSGERTVCSTSVFGCSLTDGELGTGGNGL